MEDPILKQIIKRAGTALLCALLLLSSAQAANITSDIAQITLDAEQTTFMVEVSIAQDEYFAGAEFGVDLPEGVTVTGITFLDTAIQNASKSPQLVKDGRYFFGFYDTKNSFSGSYDVARLTFTYSGSDDATIALGHSKIVTILDDGSTTGDTSSEPFTIQVTRETSGGGSTGGGSTGGGSTGGGSTGGGTDIDEPDTPLGELPFVDVEADSWYTEAVAYVSGEGLMVGTSDTTFSPDMETTRGMIMTVLARMSGVDTQGSNPWYQLGMEWAVEQGVSDGTVPEAVITREQLVTMFYRYAGLQGMDLTCDGAAAQAFSDWENVADWAAEAMAWAVDTDLVEGVGGNTLAPQGTATRAQVATILMRFAQMEA